MTFKKIIGDFGCLTERKILTVYQIKYNKSCPQRERI